MKKLITTILSLIMCISVAFCFTGCSVLDKIVDDTSLELENNQLKEENFKLKENNETLETTLAFYSKFPSGVVDEDTTITNVHIEMNRASAVAITVTDGVTLTIEDGYFDGGEGGNNQAIRVEEGGTLIIKNGTFTVGQDADGNGNSVIENRGGSITIEGGLFFTDYAYNDFYYVLNQLNSNPGTIVVKGGTFTNYDPSKGDDNLGGNFVPKGFKVESEVINESITNYTVVEDQEVIKVCFYDGETKLLEKDVDKGSIFNLLSYTEINNLIKDGYEFKGWSLTQDGEVVTFESGVFTAEVDVTYYAIFEAVENQDEEESSEETSGTDAEVIGTIE